MLKIFETREKKLQERCVLNLLFAVFHSVITCSCYVILINIYYDKTFSHKVKLKITIFFSIRTSKIINYLELNIYSSI